MATKKPAPRQPTIDDLIAGGYRYTALEEEAPPEAKPEKSSLMRRALGDTGIALAKGAIGVPEALVGMADLATGGQAGKLAEQAGFRPKEAKAILDEYLTHEQQAANQAVQQAPGFMGKLGAAVQNPSVIWQGAVESAPSMLTGAAVARGALAVAPRMGGVVAAGLGEGAVSAGQTAEQVRQETANGLLTGEQAGIAAASGALTGGIGIVAGKIAKTLGIGDIDTMLAGVKQASPKVQKGFVRRIVEGAISEGVLEELPQSVQEQVAQNMALGKPLDEGVDHAAVLGMLSGGLMGGVAGPLVGGTPEGNAIRDTKLPEVGPLTKALNAGTEKRAQEVDAGKPTVTADQATVSAKARIEELGKKEAGTKDQSLPGPDGKPVTVNGTPPQILTADEAKELEFLAQNKDNPEVLASAQGATVVPRAIPGAIDPETALDRVHADTASTERMLKYGGREDTKPLPDPAPAEVSQQDDANPPPEPTDILSPSGKPWKGKMPAQKALKLHPNREDLVLASVAGGYVLRPVKKEPTDGSVALPPETGPAGSSGAGATLDAGSLGADGRAPAETDGGMAVRDAAAAAPAADAGLASGADDAAVIEAAAHEAATSPRNDKPEPTVSAADQQAAKRAIYQAYADGGHPDDVVARMAMKAQERADAAGAPLTLWRSPSGTLGLVPAGQPSPLHNGQLVATIYPTSSVEQESASQGVPAPDVSESAPEPHVEQRGGEPVAESPSPAQEGGDGGVAPTQAAAAPQWDSTPTEDRAAILERAGWTVNPPSKATQRMLNVPWDKMSDSQRQRISAALEQAPTDKAPEQAPADTVPVPEQAPQAPKLESPAPADAATLAAETIARLKGKKIDIEVAVGDTGKTATMTMDAAEAVQDVQKRLEAARQLLRCLT